MNVKFQLDLIKLDCDEVACPTSPSKCGGDYHIPIAESHDTQGKRAGG